MYQMIMLLEAFLEVIGLEAQKAGGDCLTVYAFAYG